jgi:hypothetical protein
MTRRTAPPSGWPPPDEARLHGADVALGPLCEDIADRYFQRFPADLARYGPDVARAWEIHDTRHVVSWAIGAEEGRVDLDDQVRWLARVLEARNFPLDHLAGNLELAADVVAERLDRGAGVAGRLRDAAATVRATKTFH